MAAVMPNANAAPIALARYPLGVQRQWMFDAITANMIEP